jgi:hypothetical protein
MERESFEDDEVARLMNEAFISVKVDREERPDLDNHYMSVCQILTGSGGWPLTIIMTPEKRPFFAGTYFPKGRRFGRIGMLELVPRIQEFWAARREEILDSSSKIEAAVKELSGADRAPCHSDRISDRILGEAFAQLEADFDERHGGFGAAPKFPTPHNLTFLLRYWRREGNPKALAMVEKTLGAMRLGGINDQIGSGFHRYSTDAKWLVPHFEKMLYDQALLAIAYTEAFEATRKPEYRQTAEDTLGYVLRDLASDDGGFYSAEDADSEEEEGKFYTWTKREIAGILTPDEAEICARIFHIAEDGNYAEPGGHKTGANILYLETPLKDLSVETPMTPRRLEKRIEAVRSKLLAEREKRTRPFKDRKILTDWNGLMIAALAKAAGTGFGMRAALPALRNRRSKKGLNGRAIPEERFLEASRKAAGFALSRLVRHDGGLYHAFIGGKARIDAFIDDYAFLIWGLIELYESALEVRFLTAAVDLARHALEHFWDEEGWGFFFSSDRDKDLPFRRKEIYDGALPSGNSVMFGNLMRLSRMTGLQEFEEKADRLAAAFAAQLNLHPRAHTQFLCGWDFARGPSFEVVIAGEPGRQDTIDMLNVLREKFLPSLTVLFRPSTAAAQEIDRIAPFTRFMGPVGGKAAAYVCSNGQCRMPTTSPNEMLLSLM